MRNWAGILPEMLCLICKRVDSLKELVAFGGVCSTWRLVALEPLSLPLPWLMLAENQHDDSRDFYSITESKIYSVKLPELRGKKCMETKGWIVTASDTGEMALVQPLTHVIISLPHQNTSRIHKNLWMKPLIFVQRVVISSPRDPKNHRNCLIAIIHGGLSHIGFCRPGDKVWTVIDNNFGCGIQCLEYYRGKFYVATNVGDIWEYDLIGKSNGTDHVSPRRINVNLQWYFICRRIYLVDSEGSLLVVIRNVVYLEDYTHIEFQVLEVEVEQEGYEEVRSLGTRAIFLGHSVTLSIDTNMYPEIIPNSIYFTDDCFEAYLSRPEGGGQDMGVYNLKDKIIRPHYSGKSLSLVCPPVWTFLTITE